MIKKPKLWFAVSIATMAVSIAVIGIIRPIWGIDFTGGSLLEYRSAENINASDIASALSEALAMDVTVQTTGEDSVIVRTSALSPEQHEKAQTVLVDRELIREELRFESIGPTIGQELRRKAWVAINLAVVVIVIYLAYTFRKAAGLIASWKFGVAAVVALIHDLLFVTALFVILGKFFGASIDTLFMTAMLAILGYSVNDTIIIFNRLKEDWLISRRGMLIDIMDDAVKSTLIRSLNTSITTLFVLAMLLVFGGETIRWFIVALSVGILVGTYSSIFIAPAVLYTLAKK
jgi:preprotein translocase subunit SecF